jgi:ribose transport system permease protein
MIVPAPRERLRHRRLHELDDWRQTTSDALPAFALVGMLVCTLVLVPGARSVSGLELLLSSASPLGSASLSQMFVIVLGDIDLGTGYLVGLANVISARFLESSPEVAVGLLILVVLAYMAAGALIHLRKIPSIIVTLGASFIWLGWALVIFPIPGGDSPGWLSSLMSWEPSFVPAAVVFALVIAAVGYLITNRTAYGTVMRGAGSNRLAVTRYGWSMLRVRVVCYGLAAVFGIIAGLALTGITSSGDPNASANYTLLAIASVILGGGEFAGGRALPVGTVMGAFSISLVGQLLVFFNVSSAYQAGAQGMILVAVLAGRALLRIGVR